MFILYYVDNLTCVMCCYDCYLRKRYETGGSVITDVDCFSSHQILLEKYFTIFCFILVLLTVQKLIYRRERLLPKVL